jgi:hypothetical protein
MISRSARKALREKRASRNTQHSLRAEPYYLGDEAWHYGAPEKANPFKADTEEHADWLKGWRDAEFEASSAKSGLDPARILMGI